MYICINIYIYLYHLYHIIHTYIYIYHGKKNVFKFVDPDLQQHPKSRGNVIPAGELVWRQVPKDSGLSQWQGRLWMA